MRIPGRNAWTLICICLLVSLACDKPTPVAPVDSVLTVTANPTRIPVDGASDITVIARKADGTAVNPGTEINISTDLGTVDPKLAFTNDRGIATATLRGDGRVGTATITVSSGAGMEDEVTVLIGSRPVTLTLQPNPGRIPSTGGTSTLVASVADDLGNAIEDVVVRFSTEAGTLDSRGGAVRTDRDGDATDTLTLTQFDVNGEADGEFEIVAETIDADGAVFSDSFTMTIGGFPQTVILTPSPGTISATGEPPVMLNALVLDDSGDPVVDIGVVFGSAVGTLQSAGRQVPTDATGVATDILTVSALDLDALPASQTSFEVDASVPGLGGDLVTGTNRVLISTSVGVIVLATNPTSVTCEMAGTVDLEALVLDETGEPAEGEQVTFGYGPGSATPGSINFPTDTTDVDGIATTTLNLDNTDLPCTVPSPGTPITSFVMEARVILLGTQLSAQATIVVSGTS